VIALAPTTTARRPSGWQWPLFIVGLLSINFTMVGVTIYYAAGDKSAAVEPDYYARALNFNDTIAQRATNAKLGWTTACELVASERGRMLSVDLNDASGRAIDEAVIDAVAFSSLRASQRQTLALHPAPGRPGRYLAPVDIDRPGQWNIRLVVRQSGHTFTSESVLLVPETPAH
jgi:nitrogen fixation protein FixH